MRPISFLLPLLRLLNNNAEPSDLCNRETGWYEQHFVEKKSLMEEGCIRKYAQFKEELLSYSSRDILMMSLQGRNMAATDSAAALGCKSKLLEGSGSD